jgi:Zn-dependent peptidase ImmA (M78 family)
LERGFKAWCERFSVAKRKELQISASGPIDPWTLADNQDVAVWTPSDVVGLSQEKIDVLLRNDGTPSCWSAVTLMVGTKTVVILNSSHPKGRQANDLTHELAHRILNHVPQEMDVTPDGIMMLKSYDKVQEEEADWLSSCLLLPRDALLSIRRRRLELSDAAKEYGVSQKMLSYRLARSGVDRQLGYVR